MSGLPKFDPNLTSLTLLEKIRQRDCDAWVRLVNLYNPLMMHWLGRFGIDFQLAEDICQDVWRSVAEHIQEFQKGEATGSFRGWLWTITRNRVRDTQRRSTSQPVAMGGTESRMLLEAIPDYEPVEEGDPVGRDIVRRAVDVVKNDFSEQTWLAFVRMVLDSQDAASVAAELGMKANAVHQARFRVLRRLREVLDGLLEI